MTRLRSLSYKCQPNYLADISTCRYVHIFELQMHRSQTIIYIYHKNWQTKNFKVLSLRINLCNYFLYKRHFLKLNVIIRCLKWILQYTQIYFFLNMLWKEGVQFCKAELLWFFCCLYLSDYIATGSSYICIPNICIGVINTLTATKVGDTTSNVHDTGIALSFINSLSLDEIREVYHLMICGRQCHSVL